MIHSLVIMPFAPEFDVVYETIKQAAAAAVVDAPIDCRSLKETRAAGRISHDIENGIRNAAFCIADASECNANVMWEIGFAMALEKPTIILTNKDPDLLPFDLKDYRVIPYDITRLPRLQDELEQAIRETLARYAIRPSARPNPMPQTDRVIAVTGTMQATPARLDRRIPEVLTPYLSKQVVWLCGSFGLTDVRLLDFLIGHKQRVIAVGYHALDYSPSVKARIDAQELAFIDASTEAIPYGLDGPSERDIVFLTRSHLAIFFWDGKSAGTGELIRFFQDKRKDIVVSYI